MSTYDDLVDILPDKFGDDAGTVTLSVGSRYYVISVTTDAKWQLGRLVGGDPMAFGYSPTVEESWRAATSSVPRAPDATITAASFEPEGSSLVRCQVFVRDEMYPASWVQPWPPDWWIAEDGEPEEGESGAYHIPASLAERALAAYAEFQAVGREIDKYMEGRR